MKKDWNSLTAIARRTKPVKDYLRIFIPRYEQMFKDIRNKPLTILEIGIGGYKHPNKGGGSLRMWAEYFPNSVIVGLDFNPKQLILPRNVDVHCGSQTDIDLLNRLSDQYSGFDIVIDDASHITENTITSFETLWPHTRLFYVIEDLHMAKAKGTKEYFEGIKEADFNTKNLCVLTKSNKNNSENI